MTALVEQLTRANEKGSLERTLGTRVYCALIDMANRLDAMYSNPEMDAANKRIKELEAIVAEYARTIVDQQKRLNARLWDEYDEDAELGKAIRELEPIAPHDCISLCIIVGNSGWMKTQLSYHTEDKEHFEMKRLGVDGVLDAIREYRERED